MKTLAETLAQEQAPKRKVGRLLSDVDPDTYDWLWGNWLALQEVTILVGQAGAGKSTLVADLIARVTRSDAMPDGTPCGAPGGAVVISLEEHTSKTVVPRLQAAHADLTRVVDLSSVERTIKAPGEPSETPFMLPDDLDQLYLAIDRVKASLVVIDPLMSAVNPRYSTFRNQSARQVFTAMQQVATDTGVSIVLVNHFVKGPNKDPFNAMAGSKGFSDIARMIWMLTRDANSPDHCLLRTIKHSNAPDVPQIVFTHDGRRVTYIQGLTEKQSRLNEEQQISMGRQSVLTLLQKHPSIALTPIYISQTIGMKYDTAKSLLRRMELDGQIDRVEHGWYKLAKPVPKKQAPAPAPSPSPTAP